MHTLNNHEILEGYAQKNRIGKQKASRKTTNKQLLKELGHT
jgi:hypothetical protein